MSATTTGSGDGYPISVDLGQGQHEVERPNGVPRLQPHRILQPEFCIGAKQSPTVSSIHVRPLLLEAMDEGAGKLL